MGRELQAGKKGGPAVSLLCACPLLILGMGRDNPGTGAKMVTCTYQIRAESCIHLLVTDLCSVLGIFGGLYFFSSFPRPWPMCFVAKTLLLVKKA